MFKSFIAIFSTAAMLAVSASAAPVVTVGTQNVVFNYRAGAALPAPQAVAVTSDVNTTITGVNISYLAGGSPGWLSVFPPAPFNTPNSLSFTLSSSAPNLTPGSYIAQVSLSAPALDPASVLTTTVFLVVTGGGGVTIQSTVSTPTSLAFSWSAGSPLPAAQTLSVKVSDDSPFSVSRTTDTGSPWLIVTPASSVSPGVVTVRVDPSGLSGGTYNGVITLSAPFSVVQVPVSLTISGLGFSVTPAALTFNVPQNYGLSSPQTVQITSATNLPFTVTALAADGNWLQADLPQGTTPAALQVRVNVSSLPQGKYSGTVTIRSGSLASTDIPVALTVSPPAPVGISPSALSFTYTLGDPGPASQTTRISSLSATAQTFTSSVSTADGASWLAATANQTTTPSVVSVTVSPTGLLAGTYTGLVNIVPSLANAAPQSIQITLTVKAAPPPAVVSLNSSASYTTNAVTPGEFITLFGANIGPKALTVAPGGTAPRTLGNTTVTFDGIPAPILYASTTQTGVQVPYNVLPGQQTSVIVTYNGLTSPTIKVNVAAAHPGLFTADSSGKGQAAAVNINPTDFNSAAIPVARGSIISLYGTGEGNTTPAIVEGTITPVVQPIPSTQLPVSVTIGNQAASVLYAGEAPGSLAGLFQINVRVPDTAPTGSAISVLVFVNGIPSQAGVTIAVK